MGWVGIKVSSKHCIFISCQMVHNITPFVNRGFADSKQTQTTTTEGIFGAIRDTKRDESETNEPTKVDVSWGHGQIYSGKLQIASWPTPVGDKIVRCWAYSKHQIPTLFKHRHNPTVCYSNILKQNQQLPARQAVLHGHQMNIAFGDLLPYWQIVQLFNLILRPKWPFWSKEVK